jgi:hypothetical protein
VRKTAALTLRKKPKTIKKEAKNKQINKKGDSKQA